MLAKLSKNCPRTHTHTHGQKGEVRKKGRVCIGRRSSGSRNREQEEIGKQKRGFSKIKQQPK